jgi:hypothetical protein
LRENSKQEPRVALRDLWYDAAEHTPVSPDQVGPSYYARIKWILEKFEDANRVLVEKYYVFDEERGRGGGIYIWPSREAAARWHGEDYRKMLRSLYGGKPRIEILAAVMHVDPQGGKVVEL